MSFLQQKMFIILFLSIKPQSKLNLFLAVVFIFQEVSILAHLTSFTFFSLLSLWVLSKVVKPGRWTWRRPCPWQ